MRLTEAIIVALFACSCAATQDIPVIDMAATEQTIQPDFRPLRSGGEDLTCLKESPMRVRASLESLGANVIRSGDYVDMVVRIDNVGDAPLHVPVSPSFEKIKPEAVPIPFEYYSLVVP